MSLVNRPIFIYLTAFIINFVLAWNAYLHVQLINPDAVCYFVSAAAMGKGIHYAMSLCGGAGWPLYSWLIYQVHGLTHLSIYQSGYLVNSLVAAISVLSFIGIVHVVVHASTHSKNLMRLLWLAAMVILIANQFNGYRSDMLRDHGYWAFYLLSLIFLLNYFKQFQWIYAVGWSMSLVVATLFRIEGAMFLMVLPLCAFLDRRANFYGRIKSFFQLNTVMIVILMLLCLWVISHPAQPLSRLSELKDQLLYGISRFYHLFNEKAAVIADKVLSPYSESDKTIFLLSALLGWYVVQVICLSFIYSILIVYAWVRRVLVAPPYVAIVLWGYIALNVMVTFIVLCQNYFLSKRYLMALMLVMMVWVPFALSDLIERGRARQRWLVGLFVLIGMLSLSGVVHFGYSKAYIREAGLWAANNIPANARMYTNDFRLMYYSNHFGDTIFETINTYSDLNSIKNNRWKAFDYLALALDKSTMDIEKEIPLTPLKIFNSKNGHQVVIYKVDF